MHSFITSLKWKPGTEEADLACDGKPTLAITPPPAFGGKADCWSPEDLLVGAVESCLLLTALYFVGKLKIRLNAYRSRAEGTMAKTPNGLRFTGMTVTVTATLASPDDVPKMQQAIAQAEKFCPVSNAVNYPVKVVLETVTV
jgi:organic hydroperoxide reductase OsmC/OhrA